MQKKSGKKVVRKNRGEQNSMLGVFFAVFWGICCSFVWGRNKFVNFCFCKYNFPFPKKNTTINSF